MPKHRLTVGERTLDQGRTVLELIVEAGGDLPAVCGGGGRCGRCLVQLTEGSLSPLTDAERSFPREEQMAQGWRLACQARADGKASIEWVTETEARPGKGFAESGRDLPLQPLVHRKSVRIPPSDPEDQRGDWERCAAALAIDDAPDYWSCLGLFGLPRDAERADLLLAGGRLLGLAAPGRVLGAVFDIGTTTVVGGLVDLEDGDLLATRAAFNAQRIYGADVLSRLGHAMQGPEFRGALQARIQGQLAAMLQGLLDDIGAGRDNLSDIVLVGNTAMEHLFFGLDVSGLSVLPFVPLHQHGFSVPAGVLGLPAHPGAQAYWAPNLAGFVGADTTAGIIALDLTRREGVNLLIDLGTNGELVLARAGRLWACSTAAGPAFEGAEISCGLPGLPGAIERVDFDTDLRIQTIGQATPRGLCGSGLIDAVAVCLDRGVVDTSGAMQMRREIPPVLAPRVREGKTGLEFVLTSGGPSEVSLTQRDIRQVQLAKGAIAAGVRLLCEAAGVEPGEVDRVFLAGAFGQHVDAAKAGRIGLLPGIPIGRVKAVGNAAGEGARLILTSLPCRAEAETLADKVKIVELAARPDFQMIFADEMMFPE